MFPSPLYPPTSIFNWTGSDTPKSLSLSSLYSQKTASNGVLKVRALLYIRNRSCTLLSVGLDIGACYVLGIEDQEGSIGLTMWFFQIFPLILFYFYFYFIFFLFSFNSELKKEKKKKSKTTSFQAYLMAALIGL